MTVLDDYNFELVGDGEVDNAVFGVGHVISVTDGGFDPGSRTWATQDGKNPRGQNTTFGIDRLDGGPTWAWSLHCDTTDWPDEALDAVAELENAWLYHPAHERNGGVAVLRYSLAGRPARRVYGRPREFAYPLDNSIINGLIRLTCNFKTVDNLTYADEENVARLTAVADSRGGGLPSPLRHYTSRRFAVGGTGNTVVGGGNRPSPFTAAFKGPGVRPSLKTDEWIIQLDYTLAHDEIVTVSTYPWEVSAVSSRGNPVGLTRATRLSKARINRRGSNLVYTPSDLTGASSCEVRWRPTFSTL